MVVMETRCRKIPFQVPKPSPEKRLLRIIREAMMISPQLGGMNVPENPNQFLSKTFGGKP